MPTAKNTLYCRQKAVLTQDQLAKAIGVSRATINAWETKKRALTIPNAKRVAEFFQVDFAEFCDVDLEWLDKSLVTNGIALSETEVKNLLMFRELPMNIKKLLRYAIVISYENNIKRKKE